MHGSQELQTSFRKSSRNLSTWPGKGRADKGLRHSPAIWGTAVTPFLQNQPPNVCSEVMGNPGAAGSRGMHLCVNTDPGSSDLRV